MQEIYYFSIAAQLIALCAYAILATPNAAEMRDWVNRIYS